MVLQAFDYRSQTVPTTLSKNLQQPMYFTNHHPSIHKGALIDKGIGLALVVDMSAVSVKKFFLHNSHISTICRLTIMSHTPTLEDFKHMLLPHMALSFSCPFVWILSANHSCWSGLFKGNISLPRVSINHLDGIKKLCFIK